MTRSILICIIAFSISSKADVQIANKSVLHFASVSEGKQILTTKDDYIRRLSPFDRAARMKVDRAVSEEEFLNFVGANVAEWTKEETQKIQTTVQQIRSRFRDLSPSFPTSIQLIKTSGAEEGNAAYTRGSAIIIPNRELTNDSNHLQRLICHELFHVLSRQNPELRKQLYAIIGFSECDEIEFPRELASKKITNPDAPRNDHFIRLQYEGRERLAVPILFSKSEVYDRAKGGEFFDYLTFQFLLVEKNPELPHLKAVYENSAPKLIGPETVSGFFEQVGKNTDYIIHPEEILAENFALLILAEKKVPSPEILQKIKEVLFRKAASRQRETISGPRYVSGLR